MDFQISLGRGFGSVSARIRSTQYPSSLLDQALANGVLPQIHVRDRARRCPQTESSPKRDRDPLVSVVYGDGGGGTSPDGGTAGSVGDIHSVAEELGYKARVRSLGAAGAGTGEFKQRFFVLRGDNVHNRGCLGFFSNILDAVIKYFLLIFLSSLETIFKEFVGQTPTQTPHPIQSNGDIARVYL